jgi:hypothetical protein
MLTFKQLKALPYNTLRVIALSVAHDIDAGASDKRHLLEEIFAAIAA